MLTCRRIGARHVAEAGIGTRSAIEIRCIAARINVNTCWDRVAMNNRPYPQPLLLIAVSLVLALVLVGVGLTTGRLE
ncbi:hypothetical protein GCM10011322_47480 [Salinarimonas ramus]|uniref:Uncharacterized protein n=1 Tax=Salinarimonas ramus TaxID=690164 RepID=A0A917QKP1_9HYPH|nr:hypothetical protein GCM10011322_47480 [Salinarimonas ramus]